MNPTKSRRLRRNLRGPTTALALLMASALALLLVAPGLAEPDSLPAATAPASQPAAPVDLNSVLEPIRAEFKLPALAGAIIEGDRLTAIGAVGKRKAGSHQAVTVNDQFHLGSCTKAMTATLIGMLVEEGKLSWKTTIGQTFPELKDKIQAAYLDVTIEQLLRHRSGLAEDRAPDALFFKMKRQLKGPMIPQREKVVEWVLARPPAAPPGTRMQYSNASYVIAGAMAERATGKSWEELMQEWLFTPLGMSSAGFGPPGSADKVDQPRGHAKSLLGTLAIDPGPNADNPPWLGPAGTVHASLADWGKYASLHLEGICGRGKLIRPETLAALYCPGEGEGTASSPAHPWTADEMLALMRGQTVRANNTRPDGYAAGWAVADRPWGGTVLTHNGSNGTWFAVVWLAPQKGFAVLVATNIGGSKAPEACDRAAGALIERHVTEGR